MCIIRSGPQAYMDMCWIVCSIHSSSTCESLPVIICLCACSPAWPFRKHFSMPTIFSPYSIVLISEPGEARIVWLTFCIARCRDNIGVSRAIICRCHACLTTASHPGSRSSHSHRLYGDRLRVYSNRSLATLRENLRDAARRSLFRQIYRRRMLWHAPY